MEPNDVIEQRDIVVTMRDGTRPHRLYRDAERPSHLLLPIIP